MDEEQKQILDEQVLGRWERRWEFRSGDVEALHISIEARKKNVTELGYWRDIANGLSALVDKLRTERSAERSAALSAEAEVGWLRQERSEIHNAFNLLEQKYHTMQAVLDQAERERDEAKQGRRDALARTQTLTIHLEQSGHKLRRLQHLRFTAEVVARERNNRLAEVGRQYRAAKQHAETLATLVTEGTAELLERLVWHIDSRNATASSQVTYTARALAACIRELLEKGKEGR